MKKTRKKTVVIIGIVAIIVFIFLALALIMKSTDNMSKRTASYSEYGQIYLYGEAHANETILKKELELWHSYYHNDGLRHLFVELPYYTAEYLNLWMQSDDNSILEQLYQDWDGTAIQSESVLKFYEEIKENCPDTIFHGTDVGHQYNTTGARYLEYLEANNLADSEEYQLAKENVEQGKKYYSSSDNKYRENTMTENFIQIFESLNAESIMGIYGSAHTGTESKDHYTNSIPCMANQLKNHYGSNLHSEDLSLLANNAEPLNTETLTIGGKEYEATYLGKTDLSAILPDFQYREFWRIENAYDDFKEYATTGNVLPYNNYPFTIETGQVFAIKYTKADGTVYIEYHRSDGNTWQGSLTTEEFRIN